MSKNTYAVLGDIVAIDVSTPRYPNAVATIDRADLDLIIDGGTRWRAQDTGGGPYAVRLVGPRHRRVAEWMHRKILGLSDRKAIGDHKDKNGLNNTRENLRVATAVTNACYSKSRRNSTSAYIGVSWHKRRKKWVAQHTVLGQTQYLGGFDCEADAARAYDQAAVARDPVFASVNFPRQAS